MSFRIFVSGPPGVGKTTLVKNVAKVLGDEVGGFYTEEVRSGGRRVGFVVVDVSTGERTWLAKEGLPGPRVGRYGVNVDASSLIFKALGRGEEKRICVVDEIGPMEMRIPGFMDAVRPVLERGNVIATVHRSLFERFWSVYHSHRFWLTRENRDKVYQQVLSIIRGLQG